MKWSLRGSISGATGSGWFQKLVSEKKRRGGTGAPGTVGGSCLDKVAAAKAEDRAKARTGKRAAGRR